MTDYPAVKLSKYEWKRIRSGHPWIYPKSISNAEELKGYIGPVHIYGPKNEGFATGLYNDSSKIKVRVLSRGTIFLNGEFWESRIRTSLAYRKRIMGDQSCFRLINSESDSLSGLIVDCYDKAVLFQISSAAMENLKDSIVASLAKVLGADILVERNDGASRVPENLPQISHVHVKNSTAGNLEHYPIQINSLRYELDLVGGHKTGLYLDQIENHRKFSNILQRHQPKSVLDCFTYVGGFALNAAKVPSVKKVIALDQSRESLKTAEQNASLNSIEASIDWIKTDVFKWLREESAIDSPEKFDVIVLDPPSFTKNRHAVAGAIRGYKELHVRALKLLSKHGILFTFSCSHHIHEDMLRSIVFESAIDTQSEVCEIEHFQQSNDHPIVPQIPESYYLKGFAYLKRN